MDKPQKESYRIGKILKKLTGIKFLKSMQTSDISTGGKRYSTAYNHKSTTTTNSQKSSPDQMASPPQHVDKYVKYQKELEASNLLGLDDQPKPPGRIPKLPTGRKEIMSKSED